MICKLSIINGDNLNNPSYVIRQVKFPKGLRARLIFSSKVTNFGLRWQVRRNSPEQINEDE